MAGAEDDNVDQDKGGGRDWLTLGWFLLIVLLSTATLAHFSLRVLPPDALADLLNATSCSRPPPPPPPGVLLPVMRQSYNWQP